MILGAVVADAASMGLHWIYSQPTIRRIAPQSPEFAEPLAENYEQGPAFFAHERRHAGESSLYGEHVVVMLQSLAAASGRFDEAEFLSRYRKHFGPGGDYVGYVDTPTRETLFNAEAMVRTIRSAILDMDLDLSDTRQRQVANFVSRYILDGDMARVRELASKPLRLANTTDDEFVEIERVFGAVEKLRVPTGADDVQLPALNCVAPLVACYAGSEDLEPVVERAVRVTNNNDLAVSYAVGLARLLESVLTAPPETLGEPGPDNIPDQGRLAATILESYRDLPNDYRNDLEKALSLLRQENESITRTYGPACDCAMGTPSALHNVVTAGGFVEAVRRNIYASGDSCGRAMIVGPVMGALHGIGGKYGIRHDWIGRTGRSAEVRQLLGELLAPSPV